MEVKFLSCFYQTGWRRLDIKVTGILMLFTWPLLSQACLMLFSPCTCFKADFLVQVLVCVLWWSLCWAPSLATPVTWAVSFLESSALKITHQLLPVGYTFQPLGSLVGKALRQDLFWNGIIMTSPGQVATPLLTCTNGDSFSSQIQSSSLPYKPLWLSWAWLWCYGLLTTNSSSCPWKYPLITWNEGNVTP